MQYRNVASIVPVIALSIGLMGCGGGGGTSNPSTGSGTVTYTSLTTIGSSGTGNGQFSDPAGIALLPNGNVAAVDYGAGRVEIFSSSGEYIGQIGSQGSGHGQLQSPTQLAYENGNYFVTDPSANAVVEYDLNYKYVKNLDSSAAGGFNSPTAIAAAPDGTLYVGEIGAILVFSSNGQYQRSITTVNGTLLPNLVVTGLAIDTTGNVYLLDPKSTSTIDELAPGAGALLGQIKTIGAPYFIAVDSSGNVFFTDLTNRDVLEYSSSGTLLSTVVVSVTSQGLAVTSADNIYLSVSTSPGGYIAVYKRN